MDTTYYSDIEDVEKIRAITVHHLEARELYLFGHYTIAKRGAFSGKLKFDVLGAFDVAGQRVQQIKDILEEIFGTNMIDMHFIDNANKSFFLKVRKDVKIPKPPKTKVPVQLDVIEQVPQRKNSRVLILEEEPVKIRKKKTKYDLEFLTEARLQLSSTLAEKLGLKDSEDLVFEIPDGNSLCIEARIPFSSKLMLNQKTDEKKISQLAEIAKDLRIDIKQVTHRDVPHVLFIFHLPSEKEKVKEPKYDLGMLNTIKTEVLGLLLKKMKLKVPKDLEPEDLDGDSLCMEVLIPYESVLMKNKQLDSEKFSEIKAIVGKKHHIEVKNTFKNAKYCLLFNFYREVEFRGGKV
jgi:hypothetical protein